MNRIAAFSTVLLRCSILLVLLTSCAKLRAPEVQTHADFDRSANFESLRSYEFLVVPDSAPRDDRVDAPLVNARVQRAVAAELEHRGFVRDIHGTPDFLVVHHVLLDSRVKIDSYIDLHVYGYRNWAQGMRTQSAVRDYDEGVVILDIIAADTKTLMWRGYGEAPVDLDDAEARKRADLIRSVIAKMLEGFPPR